MSKAKWIGAAAGWFFAGPIGGIIGYHIGKKFFNKKYHSEAFTSKPHITKHRVNENHFIASSAWLCGEQLSRFVEWASSQNGIVTHRIENKNGRVSELNWRVNGE